MSCTFRGNSWRQITYENQLCTWHHSLDVLAKVKACAQPTHALRLIQVRVSKESVLAICSVAIDLTSILSGLWFWASGCLGSDGLPLLHNVWDLSWGCPTSYRWMDSSTRGICMGPQMSLAWHRPGLKYLRQFFPSCVWHLSWDHWSNWGLACGFLSIHTFCAWSAWAFSQHGSP